MNFMQFRLLRTINFEQMSIIIRKYQIETFITQDETIASLRGFGSVVINGFVTL